MRTIIGIILTVVFLSLLGCEKPSFRVKYDDIEYYKKDGIKVQIDSTEYKPVLIKVREDTIVIADERGIKDIELFAPLTVFFTGIFLGTVLGFAFGKLSSI